MIRTKEIKGHALARAELDARLADYDAALLSEDPQRIQRAQLACSVALERLLDAKGTLVHILLAEIS